jgi:hypothetical protein
MAREKGGRQRFAERACPRQRRNGKIGQGNIAAGEGAMGTLRSVWDRLKGFLAQALQGKGRAPGAKADPKKMASAVQQFTSHFQPVFAEIDKHYKAKAQIEVNLKKSADSGLKLVQALKQQVVAADKDGFTTGDLRESLEGRLR